MNENETKELIRSKIKEIAFRNVGDTDELMEQHILDSMGAVDLAVALEAAFGISIPFVDINKQQFASVESLAAYVTLKRG
ncbi:MAG: acyl carrier protein [Bacteroidetes bacterium]|nr:acyl carrier protein [Bacteroidota bacterium]